MIMDKFREEIDDCDRQLVTILKKRFNIVKRIGEYKKANNIPIVDSEREKKVYEKVRGLADENLSPDVIEKIYRVIISSAVNLEEK
jgi:monofunctional chorismate mutase